jgi:hypothetical protein
MGRLFVVLPTSNPLIRKRLEIPLDKAEWDETKHPRDERGRFAPKPGSEEPVYESGRTFGIISEKDIDDIEREVPGIKAFYNSLDPSDRPNTALQLIARFMDFEKEVSDLKKRLSEGTKVMLTVKKSDIPYEEAERRNRDLSRALRLFSEDVTEQEGRYSGESEPSLLVSLRPDLASLLQDMAFKAFNQEAIVLLQNGKAELRFSNGELMESSVDEIEVVPDAVDNYTKIGNVRFRFPFKPTNRRWK